MCDLKYFKYVIKDAYVFMISHKVDELTALTRVFKHRDKLLKLNPMGPSLFDQPLRAALTTMVLGKQCSPNKGSAIGLRYLRDRISVPRDMPLLAARKLRQALERTAQIDGMTM